MRAPRRIGLVFLFFFQLSPGGFCQSGIITTYVGPGRPISGALATTQAIDNPYGVATDRAGGLYVSSFSQHRVYRVGADGKLSVAAGAGKAGFSGDGGPAPAAQLYGPWGMAADNAGNLYFTDYLNSRIRKVTVDGAISTVAGNGGRGFSGDGGPATAAQLGSPVALVVDSAGVLYFADSFSDRVRKVTPAGVISTVAGNGTRGFSGDGGPATAARLAGPTGVAFDAAGNLYIADTANQRIRKITSDGVISTVAGNGIQGFGGDGGPAATAELNVPFGVAVDSIGNLYIADSYNSRIRRVTATGVISTLAGDGTPWFGGDGGLATAAQVKYPVDVAVDSAGNLYIADSSQRIRKVTPAGVITTVAGNGTAGFSGDGGTAAAALLNYPADVAVDTANNLYIADSLNARIRRVDASGVIRTIAGGGTSETAGDGGPATAARLNFPVSVGLDSAGNLYVAESNRLRKITASGIISTVAGNGTEGFSGDGGPAAAANLNYPSDSAVDSEGSIYIADRQNNRIRKVTPAGMISTVAGSGEAGYSGDGGPATTANLYHPSSVAIDSEGNLYVADTDNNRIRKVTAAGVINTVAGNGWSGFGGDYGPATEAQIQRPTGVTVDFAGNLYVTAESERIRKVTAGGVITTVAGNGIQGFNGDGGPAMEAHINGPHRVAVDAAGNLFIADTGGNRVRKVTASSTSRIFFPQVAVGGGYSTLFTVTNTGATSASARLSLTDQDGNPLAASGTLTDSSGVTQPASAGNAFTLVIPSGGTVFLSAAGLAPGTPLKVGWGQLESTGGSITAVATYEYVVAGSLQTTVAVPQSQPLQSATIPVDNDNGQGKQIAFAIANPGSQTITVKLALAGQDGFVVDEAVTVTLGAGKQTARYLWQDLGRTRFRGSLVISGQYGATFVAVALLDKQGFLTVIPLIPGKAPGVPD
jgi:trimeric autotransporter adhesin